MLTLSDFHAIAQQHPEADILLQQDEEGKQTLQPIAKKGWLEQQLGGNFLGRALFPDPKAFAHQQTRSLFSRLVKEKVEALGATMDQWSTITNISPALQKGEVPTLSAAKIVQVMQSIPSPWNVEEVDYSLFPLPRPNEAGMKKIFAQTLVSFNEPAMGQKMIATEKSSKKNRLPLKNH